MIQLEHWQVTSLELSKRLKELEVKQDSFWYWVQGGKYPDDWSECTLETKNQIKDYDEDFICSAFTVAEHGIALPRSIRSYRDTNAKEEFWVCKIPFQKTEYADTEANARAQMRIWLIENKLVEVKPQK